MVTSQARSRHLLADARRRRARRPCRVER